ncbi:MULTISPECIES: sugar transferase [Bacteroidales]|jgi:lipopolysaccharide/colanic/teichoic acid biosynthesis glycosyltransferase|uniref:sugar transferase n=1 Tax=Bacteroidales TaxID=171549 RepID=UPI00259BD049|nr:MULTISPECIES: sugar transferase [Bacteroidales]
MYKHFFKRAIDIIASGSGLLLLSPLLLVVTLWLHFANKGAGAFFFQERPGKNARIFKIYKFKSMTDARDADGNLLPNEQRITKAGKFIRNTSIDELPQLWNVLKGDMSIIGPRPLPIRYLELYSNEQAKRHDVRPGISGWAQVNGRNNISWARKFELDVYYVKNLSLLLDVKIIFLTIKKVFMKEDINSGNNTVGSIGFNGNN